MVGVSAHITAASPEGPRYDSTMSAEERRSPSNGIWLCQIHAKAIDDDEERFSVSLLHAWKNEAERRARDEIGRPQEREHNPRLIEHRLTVNTAPRSDIYQLVEHFVGDIGLDHRWGHRAAEAVFLTLYELAVNAFEHSGAQSIELVSEQTAVSLQYSGSHFGLNDLLNSEGRGGQASLQSLQDTTDIVVTHKVVGDSNVWTFVDKRALGSDGPCSAELSELWNQPAQVQQRLAGCEEVHAVVERGTFSDVAMLCDVLVRTFPNRPVVLHGASEDRVAGQVRIRALAVDTSCLGSLSAHE